MVFGEMHEGRRGNSAVSDDSHNPIRTVKIRCMKWIVTAGIRNNKP